ncbi:hypothetical protein CEXT_620381 [Caerostris extrusa]|uniref:Uncharacterized protein n=1 Tax=Caerostris extrusa TaxID=172846 RepID=A0AAV4P1Y8_CAEEX|nr:hypothetical protein CEXT_620381 [Caerostris extrusa]
MHHIKGYEEEHFEAMKILGNSFYIDAVLLAEDSTDEALSVFSTAVKVLKEVGRTKWLRDKPTVMINNVLIKDENLLKGRLGQIIEFYLGMGGKGRVVKLNK